MHQCAEPSAFELSLTSDGIKGEKESLLCFTQLTLCINVSKQSIQRLLPVHWNPLKQNWAAGSRHLLVWTVQYVWKVPIKSLENSATQPLNWMRKKHCYAWRQNTSQASNTKLVDWNRNFVPPIQLLVKPKSIPRGKSFLNCYQGLDKTMVNNR